MPLSKTTFEEIDLPSQDLRPLWSLEDLEDEKDVLDWCKKTVDLCQSYYRYHFQVQMDNLLLYKGIQWLNQDKYSNRFLDRNGVVTRRSPKVVINHLFDFVEQWVSRLTRFRPVVAVSPTNTEWEDAQDAKISKDVLDHIWYQNTIDNYCQEFARQTKIFGEAYMFITWNKNKGDLHPDYVKLNSNGVRAPVLDQAGQPVMGEKGQQLFIDKAVRVGDVEYKIEPPWHVYDQPCRNRDNIDWTIRWTVEDVDYLKAKYPDKAKDIVYDGTNQVFENYRLDIGKLKNEVVTYELFHKSTEFLDKGRYIKFTRGAILENTTLPYQHGNLPYVRLTDIDVPDQIRGMSFFQQLFPLQHQINACASLIYKSLVLFAHPKIVMPDGACEINQLVNESTIVTYQGGIPPTLMASSPVSGELFSYLDKLEITAEKLSGIFTMSRGQAPSGVRAAKALRVLEEQEDKRAHIMSIKYNQNALVENAKMTLSVAGTYYQDSDGRLARVVGKNNEFRLRAFKKANLSKPYDIRIENTTALSQSPAARIEEVTELANIRLDPMSPISKEQFVHFLDFGRSEEFRDALTRSIECARSENEDLLYGQPVAPPRPDEDLIGHWREHKVVPQSREYKEGIVPETNRKLFEEHFYNTEYLMFIKAFGLISPLGAQLSMGNPNFQAQLSMLPDWPLVFKIPVPGQMGGAPGQMNGGMNQIDGSFIPPSGLTPSPIPQQPPMVGEPAMSAPPMQIPPPVQ